MEMINIAEECTSGMIVGEQSCENAVSVSPMATEREVEEVKEEHENRQEDPFAIVDSASHTEQYREMSYADEQVGVACNCPTNIYSSDLSIFSFRRPKQLFFLCSTRMTTIKNLNIHLMTSSEVKRLLKKSQRLVVVIGSGISQCLRQ